MAGELTDTGFSPGQCIGANEGRQQLGHSVACRFPGHSRMNPYLNIDCWSSLGRRVWSRKKVEKKFTCLISLKMFEVLTE
jgi:hypothetical protein